MRSPGYWIEEGIFSQPECEAISRFFYKDNIGRSRAGIRNLMRIDEVSSLATDERLLRIGAEISGKQLIPYKATLFEKTGKANWLVVFHQDTALPVESEPAAEGWGPTSQKSGVIFSHAPSSVLRRILAIRIHLDPSSPSNGPLRVIPDSHERRLNDDEFEEMKATTPAVLCCVGKGGIIAMSPLLLHASSKSETDDPRRVLHIEYADSLDLEGARLAIA
jgi:ectoine hydroxylase-related dioxygenase (phytanoyl-CoA dioxygenase family)